ncbi:MAG: Na+/H+ antiporter NhaC family protein [Ruminococcaceae bacterium]|nr:Na+/H+ antiporter NhaC family protein [Oscillospiraceae bacterium]
MKRSRKSLAILMIVMVLISAFTMTSLAAGEEAAEGFSFVGTIWALLPPVVAIGLALITKEVYSSLFVGILVGGLLYSNFNPIATVDTIVSDGLIAKLADSWNVGILLFLVMLGILVALINKAGGSAAFGRWAEKNVKTKTGAMLASFALGVLIFVDDYFNCLTVGSVMRPVSDANKISRAKLAYIIDATAAPICMIAPISSWACAVASSVEGTALESMSGFTLFIRAIPFNFYSLLTIVMVIAMAFMKFDYGPMKKHEKNAENGDLFTVANPYANAEETVASSKGKVIDLVFPILLLIVVSIIALLRTGGLFEGAGVIEAFENCDAALGLSWAALISLVVTMIYFLLRRVMTFKEMMECVPQGFNAMVPAILILTFAWTLGGVTGMLQADVYVAGIIDGSASLFANFLPAIIFVIALGLAFATGTSWGTFAILIPIVINVFMQDETMMTIAISACLAGAVCGDHCSPISDTTIMASTGARCDHVAHVSTQLPYALTVAAVSFVAFIIAGFVKNAWIALPIAIVMMLVVLFVIKAVTKKDEKAA